MADAPTPAVPQPLRRGDPPRLGPFHLRGRLGAGGMGVVYVGVDGAGREAAVKLPREEYAEDPVFRARFAREVAAAQRVDGRFTASVLGASVDDDRPWLATELVPGPSLGALVERFGPLRHPGQAALGAGLAEALVAIHRVGLVHRDLKPNNVLCAPDGPRVIDFGISVAPDSSRLTQAGMVLGSPAWMAPEHLRGEQVGPAADVFGWGLLVAYAATGRSAFGEGSPQEMLHNVLYGVPDLGRAGMLAPAVRPLVVAALSRDPGQRPTAASVCAAMAGLPAGDDDRAAAGAGALVARTWVMPHAPAAAYAGPAPGPAAPGYAPPAAPPPGHAAYGPPPPGQGPPPPAYGPGPAGYGRAPGAAGPFASTRATGQAPSPPTPSGTYGPSRPPQPGPQPGPPDSSGPLPGHPPPGQSPPGQSPPGRPSPSHPPQSRSAGQPQPGPAAPGRTAPGHPPPGYGERPDHGAHPGTGTTAADPPPTQPGPSAHAGPSSATTARPGRAASPPQRSGRAASPQRSGRAAPQGQRSGRAAAQAQRREARRRAAPAPGSRGTRRPRNTPPRRSVNWGQVLATVGFGIGLCVLFVVLVALLHAARSAA